MLDGVGVAVRYAYAVIVRQQSRDVHCRVSCGGAEP